MADNNQVNIEALVLKCFLYKYTPPFTKTEVQTKILSTFDPYTTVLDDTQFFTKYDISSFVSAYSFDQNIDETTYSWTVELQDLALSYGTIDSKLRVTPPPLSPTKGLAFSTSTDSIARLAEYELNANNNTDLNLEIVESAKKHRGRTPASLTVQNTGLNQVLSTTPGLRLSDLIQEYDFISLFLYKNTTPLDEVVGVLTLDTKLQHNSLWKFTPGPTGQALVDPYLQYESVLLTPMPNGQPLFANEFNGYVMRKSIASAIGQVDKLVLNGNGWSRLLGATRRVVKPSLFQGSLYQQGQLVETKALSAFQTVFAGRPISYIIKDLFDLVFRVDFNSTNSTATSITLLNSFFNLSSMIVGNSYPANLFTLPQYLLGVSMKRRNFAYIEPINPLSFIATAQSSINTQYPGQQVPQEAFQTAVQGIGGQVINYGGTNPVVVTEEVQGLQAYFEFLAEVYKNFSPDLKTPYEILNEIRNLTFIEIFEQPNGQFIVRSPQYNNTSVGVAGRTDVNMIRSGNLNIISTNYGSNVENLVTKLFTGYSTNLLPSIPGLEQFAYCDGKLLNQFGLMESSTVANPNVNLQKSTNSNVNENKTNGLTEYARYMMQILNARLKVGAIACDLDTSAQVGHTFIDEAKYKFGYISRLSKQVSVSGTATMSLGLSYVRDALPTTTSFTETPNATTVTTTSGLLVTVEELPVIADIERSFSGS